MQGQEIIECNKLIAELLNDKIILEEDGICIISDSKMWFSGNKRLEQYQKDWLIEALDNLTFDEIKIIEPFGITTFTPPNITVDGNKLQVCIKNNVEKLSLIINEYKTA